MQGFINMAETIKQRAKRYFIAYNKGKSLQDIADEENLSKNAIHQVLKRVPQYEQLRAIKTDKPLPTKAQLVKMRETMSYQEIADLWDLDINKIFNLCNKFGIAKRRNWKLKSHINIEKKNERVIQIKNLIKQGLTFEVIAETMQLHIRTVKRLYRESK